LPLSNQQDNRSIYLFSCRFRRQRLPYFVIRGNNPVNDCVKTFRNPSDFSRDRSVPSNRFAFGFIGVLPSMTSLNTAATCSPCWPANCPLGECSEEALSPIT